MDKTVIEKTFLEKTVEILRSLGYSPYGCTWGEIKKMMEGEGYKEGYDTWIRPEDIIPDEEGFRA